MEYPTKIAKYLETVCQQIRWKKAHNIISEEIENHIIDQKNAFIDQGLDEDTAIDMAIKEMGDPVIVGTELDRTHRPKTQWGIIFLTGIILLLGFGIRAIAGLEADIPYTLERDLMTTAVGIICMAVAYFLDFTIIGRYPKTIFWGLTVATVTTMILSPVIQGRPYYVSFLLLLFPLVMAGIIYKMRDKGYLGIILSGLFFLIPIVIGIVSSYLSIVILCGLSFLVLITISITKGWFNVNKLYGLLLVYIPTIVMASIVLYNTVLRHPYMQARILAVMNPFLDSLGSGYIPAQMRTMLSNAKLIGRGTLENRPYMIPEVHTNFILTYLIHRLGWIPFIMVMGIISLFIIYSFRLISKQKSVLARLVATAVLTTFTMEVVLYTISNLGLPLIVSLTLPFISYSGMSTIVNMTLIGVMLSVFKSGDIVKDSLLVGNGARGKLLEIVDRKIIIDLNNR